MVKRRLYGRKPSLSGCGAMMNADECRVRAEKCLAAARHASDRDAQRGWRQLSVMWSLWSGRLVRISLKNMSRQKPKQRTAEGQSLASSQLPNSLFLATGKLRTWQTASV